MNRMFHQYRIALLALLIVGCTQLPTDLELKKVTFTLGTPGGLFGLATAPDSVMLSWDAVQGAQQYRILRRMAGASLFMEAGNSTGARYTDTGLFPNQLYDYVVVAGNDGGDTSVWSGAVSVTTEMLPSPPQNLRAAAESSTSIYLTWDSLRLATSYRIWRKIDTTGAAYELLTVTDATAYRDNGLNSATMYYYQIAAGSIDHNESDPTTAVSTATQAAGQAPSIPAGIAATALSSASVQISWSASLGGATSYRIYRAEQLTGTYGQVGSAQGSPFVDAGLSASTIYYYRVTAVNSVGESGASVSDSAMTQAPAMQAPSAPDSVLATANSSSSIEITWKSTSGATSYIVMRSASSGGTYTQAGVSSTNQFTDAGLTASTAYYYVIIAVNTAGNSPNSSAATATTQAEAVLPPAQPTGVGATAKSSSTIEVTWTTTERATSYSVYRSDSTGANYLQVGTAATTSYTDATDLTPSTSYLYRVKAVNNAGESVFSDPVRTTTQAPATVVPLAPINVSASGRSSNMIEITWAPAGGATYYTVYRRDSIGTFVSIGTVPGTIYRDTGLVSSTTYAYAVKSGNTAGLSVDYSQTANGRTQDPPQVAPAAPTGLNSPNQTATTIQLAWLPVNGATLYKVIRGSAGTTADTVARVTSNGCVDTGLTPLTLYSYLVIAENTAGRSPLSSQLDASTKAAPLQPPPAPTGLIATGRTTTAIDLRWNASVGATSYRIHSSVTAGGPYNMRGSVNGTVFTDTGVQSGITYYYVVTAVNGAGASGNSTESQAKTTVPSPGAPDTVGATARSSTMIMVTWNKLASADGYVVYRANATGGWDSIITTTSAMDFVNDGGLVPYTSYSYAVKAFNQGGYSPLSRVVSATTLEDLPEAPQGLQATAQTPFRVQLTWNMTGSVSRYVIVRSAGSMTDSIFIQVTTPLRFIDTGCVPATAYSYMIAAINTAGTGSFSTPAPVSTPAALPDVPTGLGIPASSITQTSCNLTWTAVSGATDYVVRRVKLPGTFGADTFAQISTGINFTDANLTAGTAYSYSIAARNTYGTSAFCTGVVAVTQDVPWQVVGTGAIGNTNIENVKVAASASGKIFVSFTNPAANGEGRLYAYEANNWGIVTGGDPYAASPTGAPAWSFYSDMPYFAYVDLQGVRVKRFTDPGWYSFFGNTAVSTGGGPVFWPAVSINNSLARPYVSFVEANYIYIVKDTGSATPVVVTYENPNGGTGGYERLQMDASSDPVIAYRDNGRGGRLFVDKYLQSTSVWLSLSNAAVSTGAVGSFSFVLDANSNPIVAFVDSASAKVKVMRFDFGAYVWNAVGEATLPSGISEVSLAIDAGNQPVIACVGDGTTLRVSVYRFDGSSWRTLGGASASAAQASFPSIYIANSQAYVAFRDTGVNGMVTVLSHTLP